MADALRELQIFELMRRLREAGIYFRLDSVRDDALMLDVAVPGERWEIEVHAGGDVEIERFRSDGKILDAAALDELILKYSDRTTPSKTDRDSR